MASRARHRCEWCEGSEIYTRYHDTEWGVPVHDDRSLFEFLVLEGAQAGLSWLTILKKRDAYRTLFDGFDAQEVARYGPRRIDKLLRDPRIVRNRLKVESAVHNARAFLKVQEAFGSFDHYQWRFVDGRPRQSSYRSWRDIPATTPDSERFSRDLRQRGFCFVGPTIVYAHMQATGMVNDHVRRCFRRAEVRALR